ANQGGHSDSEVHVLPVGEFPGNAGGQLVPGPAFGFVLFDVGTPVLVPDGFGAGRNVLVAVVVHSATVLFSIRFSVAGATT
ncbi:hypothetical protein, partial [Chryseobacterium sp. SIMBA_029]|uniref:hypothetical protein n=1 Tax=Chryseobacterium sp. SIMBA_029 TaxID=3085772 RepID=UPI00397DCF3C